VTKFRTIKNALIGGEISPTAFGRTDLQSYQFACEQLVNMIPMLSGGAYRRPGTYFRKKITNLAGTSVPTRLIPFIRSESETDMFGVHERDATSTFIESVKSGSVTGTMPTTTALTREQIQFCQSADVLFLVHANMKPQRITRTASSTYSCAAFDGGLTSTARMNAWPYLASRTDIDISPSATSGSVTLTASSAFFVAGHVGSLIKLNHSGTFGCAEITAYTNPTTVTATVVVNFGATSASDAMYESAWSDYRGWPRTVALFEKRILYGGNLNNPDTIWNSQTDNYNVLSIEAGTAPSDSDPFSYFLQSGQLNLIQWLNPGDTLLIGTQADEWLLSLTDVDYAFQKYSLRRASEYGSSYLQPLRYGNAVYFVSKSGTEVRELFFNDPEQAYAADPLQILYDEYPKIGGVTSIERKYSALVWDKSRSSLWGCDPAGNLFGCVRDRRLQALAWHRHALGGSGKVSSIAVLPHSDIFGGAFSGTSDVWFCVQRTINGGTVYYVESMAGDKIEAEDAYDISMFTLAYSRPHCFTDCSLTFTNQFPFGETYPTEFYLDHLIGSSVVGTSFSAQGIFAHVAQTVSVMADPAHYGVTFPEDSFPAYETVPYAHVFGFAFTSIVAPVRVEAGSQIGSAQSARKRIHDLTVRFYKTINAKIGDSATSAIREIFRKASTPLNKSADLFTGDKKVSFNGSYDRDGYVYIEQDQPLPFAVCAIIYEGVTYD
jgi:hypothetical protein